jgi:hypothetical protein
MVNNKKMREEKAGKRAGAAGAAVAGINGVNPGLAALFSFVPGGSHAGALYQRCSIPLAARQGSALSPRAPPAILPPRASATRCICSALLV